MALTVLLENEQKHNKKSRECPPQILILIIILTESNKDRKANKIKR